MTTSPPPVPPDRRIDLVARLTGAIAHELARLDPAAPVPWPELPDVRAMAVHVGVVHRWVSAILRTRGPVDESVVPAPTGALVDWYASGRDELLAALQSTGADTECWVLGASPRRAGFWRRRMVFENVKHLMDLRAAGGRWEVAPELMPEDFADGVDELFDVMLPRSRGRLARLPGSVLLETTDTGDRWLVSADWSVAAGRAAGAADGEGASATIRAAAGAIALLVWERAAVTDPRITVEGDPATATAFAATRIHPW